MKAKKPCEKHLERVVSQCSRVSRQNDHPLLADLSFLRSNFQDHLDLLLAHLPAYQRHHLQLMETEKHKYASYFQEMCQIIRQEYELGLAYIDNAIHKVKSQFKRKHRDLKYLKREVESREYFVQRRFDSLGQIMNFNVDVLAVEVKSLDNFRTDLQKYLPKPSQYSPCHWEHSDDQPPKTEKRVLLQQKAIQTDALPPPSPHKERDEMEEFLSCDQDLTKKLSASSIRRRKFAVVGRILLKQSDKLKLIFISDYLIIWMWHFTVQSIGLLLLPPFIYILYKKWHLNENQLMMLLVCCFMLAGLAVGGWVSTLSCLVGYGYHHFIVLEAARGTNMFRRAGTQGHSPCVEKWFMLPQNQIKLFVYLIYFWLGIRISSLKSVQFDMGGGTFVSLIAGWNCLLPDWWVIYGIWLLMALLALFSALFLICNDDQSTTLYKWYLVKYKITWDIFLTIFAVSYHFYAYSSCISLSDCQKLYNSDRWARCIWLWGVPLSTLLFFWQRHGVFEEKGTSQTDGSNQQQKQLKEMMVDQQYDQRVNHQK